jgi:hypothetical protein
MEKTVERTVPRPPSIVLTPPEMPPVKLCGGETFFGCPDVGFTDIDLAVLVLDILGLKKTDHPDEALGILESLNIAPTRGWSKSNPARRMTSREIEEVRCSVSLAYNDKLIRVAPSTVTAALENFCQEVEVSLRAIEHSGVARDNRSGIPPEAGYQGATGGVTSSPF